MNTSQPDAKFAGCIEACLDCQAACQECQTACIDNPQVKEMLRCILLSRDCGLFCHTTALLLQHGSEFLEQVCLLCLEVCKGCAEESARFTLPQCRRVTESSRRCVRELGAVLPELGHQPAHNLPPHNLN